jgi:transcriptional regulator with XRE-family HTH domain
MANFEAVTTSSAVLGAILAKLRTEKGMKQGELADKVEIGASTWSRIEKGESGISIEQLRSAAKALGVKPGLIFEMLEAAEKAVGERGVRIEPTNSSIKATATIVSGTTGAAVAGAAAAAASGAAIGTVIPIIGTALGAMIGGAMFHFFKDDDKKPD